MASIANLLISLKADFGDADQASGNLIDRLDEVGKKADETKDHLSEMKGGTEEGGEGFDALSEHLSDLSQELLKFGLEALELTSIFEALKEAVSVSSELEASRVALESFTGSAQAANEVIEKMEKIAHDEALAFPEIIPAAQHMIALGLSAEGTERAIAAAGNASHALNAPLESITQRMSYMALSGVANSRSLRSLGVSAEELGKIMGVSAGEFSKAFRVLDQEDRTAVLAESLKKFGDQGAKAAQLVSGEWTNLKNSWHAAFAQMGDDLNPITKGLLNLGTQTSDIAKSFIASIKGMGEEFPILAHLATTASQTIVDSFALMADSLSNDKKIDSAKIFKRSLDQNITYAEASKRTHAESFVGPQQTDEEKKKAEEAANVAPDVKAKAQEGLGPERAKQAAANQLAIINATKEANNALASLQRERATTAIEFAHSQKQAEIDLIQDNVTRARESAAEEINVTQQKFAALGQIAITEAQKNASLLESTRKAKLAQTYTLSGSGGEDTEARASKMKAVETEIASERQKIEENLNKQLQKLADDQTKALGKNLTTEANLNREASIKSLDEWVKFFDGVTKESKTSTDALLKDSITAGIATGDALRQAKLASQEQGATSGKLASERAYGEQLTHTFQQELQHIQQLANYEEVVLSLKAQELLAEADIADAGNETAKAEQLRASALQLQNQLLNTQFQTETKIGELKQQHSLKYQVGTEIKNSAQQVPSAVGNALAGGLVNHQQGQNIGQEITKALKNVGQQLLGTVFTSVIHQLISSIITNTGMTALLNTAFGIHTATVAASTIATGANVVATGANAAATGVNALSTDLNTVSTNSNTLWLAIKAVAGFLGFAEGGEPPLGVPSIVGEKGPELFVPKQAGTIIPHSKVTSIFPGGAKNTQGNPSDLRSGSTEIHLHGANFYGVANAREMMRQVAGYSKNQGIGQRYSGTTK